MSFNLVWMVKQSGQYRVRNMDLFSMLYPSSNPQKDYEQSVGYMQPYYDTGIKAMNDYYNQIGKLIQNPTGLEDQIMGKYSMSPYAQYQTNTLSNMSNNQAALAGNLGTPDSQKAMMNQEQGIVSKDQQNYLRNAMQPYEMGLQGEQFLTSSGQRAGSEMARQKDLEALLAEKQGSSLFDLLGGLIGGGSQIASSYFGG